MNETFTREAVDRLLELMKEANKDQNAEWFMYVHPYFFKHHPTVRYLKRYDRRGEKMKKKGQKK